jgi:hypothetical protein
MSRPTQPPPRSVRAEEEELIIITGPKKVAKWVVGKARGLCRSATAVFHALWATFCGFLLQLPGGIEWLQLNIIWLVKTINDHLGLLVPALDARTAAWLGFSFGVLTILLRGRSINAGPPK